MKINYLFLLATIALSSSASAQFCLGSSQLMSAYGLPTVAPKTLQVEASFNHHRIGDILDGTIKTKADNFMRRSYIRQAQLRVGYTFSDRWSTELLSKIVDQDSDHVEGITHSFPQKHIGLGDISLLIKYKIIDKEKTRWTLGAGPELPTGNFSLYRSFSYGNPMVRSIQEQPGSGSWDAIFWTEANAQLFNRPTTNIAFNGFYKYNTGNNSAAAEVTSRLGNELFVGFDLSEKIAIKKMALIPSLGMKYRNLGMDEEANTEIPCSGGEWLFVKGGLTFWWNDQTNIDLAFHKTIYANVNLMQTSTTYFWKIGIYRDFQFSGS